MKQSPYTYYLLLIASVFCIVSFFSFDQKKEEPEELIQDEIPPLVQKELDQKLEVYKQIILDKCRTKAIQDAEFYIDSLVAEELKFQTGDTLKFPAKPKRPDLREPIILNDTTAISPIINQ